MPLLALFCTAFTLAITLAASAGLLLVAGLAACVGAIVAGAFAVSDHLRAVHGWVPARSAGRWLGVLVTAVLSVAAAVTVFSTSGGPRAALIALVGFGAVSAHGLSCHLASPSFVGARKARGLPGS